MQKILVIRAGQSKSITELICHLTCAYDGDCSCSFWVDALLRTILKVHPKAAGVAVSPDSGISSASNLIVVPATTK